MAVVSISRIQIRRGRKNTGTGLPQLASGEFGWAVDSQELYIGNGAVSEGAPYVGNTKILSEHDDIFAFADNYTYKGDSGIIQTGPDSNTPVVRSLQDRLDDIVSIRSFGATGNGTTNDTAALQRAIEELFLNPANASSRSRVVLNLDPGTYIINSTVYIPPYTTIKGAGKDKTIIRMTGSGPAFKTVASNVDKADYENVTLAAAVTTNTQSRNVDISDLTIEITQTDQALVLQNTRNSSFRNIGIKGNFASGDDSVVATSQIGIELNALTSAVTSKENLFSNVEFRNLAYGVRSIYDVVDNTFDNCLWNINAFAVELGNGTTLGVDGQETGPSYNTITNSIFRDIDKYGVWVANGVHNKSSNNKYYDVGNDSGNDSRATYSVIQFDTATNVSEGDWFERTEALSYNQTYINGVPYVPEVGGEAIYEQGYTNKLRLGNFGTYEKLFRLPGDAQKGVEVSYLYVSKQVDAMRQGTLSITANPATVALTWADEYEFVGDSAFEERLSFQPSLVDEDLDGTVDTIAVNVLNSTASDNADFYWTIKTKT